MVSFYYLWEKLLILFTMLFDAKTYSSRRAELREKVGRGLIILLGNNNAPCNYPANGYTFRQDSSFLYFTGQDRDTLALVIDADSGHICKTCCDRILGRFVSAEISNKIIFLCPLG